MDKETLQKKIESGDTVWTLRYGKIIPVKINFTNTEYGVNYEFVWGNSPDVDGSEIYETKYLFATREEAEWQLEFGNITRTEKLELPTWEKMQEIERFDFKGKDGHRYTMYFISGFRTLAITGIIRNEYYGEATYENYLEACRICKKLFLGEEL